MKLERGEAFQAGEVWMSPKGVTYKVIEVNGREAVLRRGVDGDGRKYSRWFDDVIGWTVLAASNQQEKG